MSNDKLLMDSKEAARALSISERTLWGMTWPRGDLLCVKIGRLVKYDPADLRAWIERRKGETCT